MNKLEDNKNDINKNNDSDQYRYYMDLARATKRNIKIKDRKYHFKTYRECVLGSDVVTFLMGYLPQQQQPQLKKASALGRKDALRIGREMIRITNCMEHVVDGPNRELMDDYLFYRFTTEFVNAANTTSTKRQRQPSSSSSSTTSYDHHHHQDLEQVMRTFQKGVQLQNRTYHLRTYANVFVGSEAIDFLLEQNFAANRQQALELGRRLQDQYKLFVHVTGEHQFKDEYIFYRMLVPKLNANQKDKEVHQQIKQDLKNWIYIFTVVAMVIYYYLF